jgi:hypothetical protein
MLPKLLLAWHHRDDKTVKFCFTQVIGQFKKYEHLQAKLREN